MLQHANIVVSHLRKKPKPHQFHPTANFLSLSLMLSSMMTTHLV